MGYNLVAIPKVGEDLPTSTEMHRRLFADYWHGAGENTVKLQPVDVRRMAFDDVRIWRGIRFETVTSAGNGE